MSYVFLEFFCFLLVMCFLRDVGILLPKTIYSCYCRYLLMALKIRTRRQRFARKYLGGKQALPVPKRNITFSLLPEQVDLSPRSLHWFPIADFHYVMHYVEDNPHILERYERMLQEGTTPGLRLEGLFNFALLPSSGLNVQNYLVLRSALMGEGLLNGHLSLGDYKSEKLSMHYHGYTFVANDLSSAAQAFLYPRVIVDNKLQASKAMFWSKLPWLGKSRRYQSTHLKLQERFNEQTRRSEAVHFGLEELLSAGDVSQPDDHRRLLDLAGKIDYDVGALKALELEEREFRRIRPGIWFKPETGLDKVDLYGNIIEQKRTSLDLVRNLVMRGVAEGLEVAFQLYDDVDDPVAKEIIADRFLRNVDLSFYIQSVVPKFDQKVVRKSLASGCGTFSDVYDQWKDSIAEELGIVARVERYHQRYRDSMSGNNTEFLLRSMGNESEFESKRRFDLEFGTIPDLDIDAAYDFVRECNSLQYRRIHRRINDKTLSAWMQVADEGLLDVAVEITPEEFEIVAREIQKNSADSSNHALLMLRFLNDYDATVSLVEEGGKESGGRNPLSRMQILRGARYDIMQDHLNHILDVDTQRNKFRVYKLLRPRVFTSEEPVRRVIDADLDFALSYLEVLRDLKRNSYQHGGDREYLQMMGALASADSTEQREKLVEQYLTRAYPPETSPEVKSEEKKTKLKRRKVLTRDDDRASLPQLKSLVIVGGLPGIDYGARLSSFAIDNLTVLGPNDLRRLDSVSSDAAYLMITSTLSHAAMKTVQCSTDLWAYSSTHGQRNLLMAATRLYEQVKGV